MPVFSTREEIIWSNRVMRVSNLSWGQEFSAGLPDVIAMVSGTSVWRGSCDIVHDQEFARGGANPWSEAYPKPGEFIELRLFIDERLIATHRPIIDEIRFSLNSAHIEFLMPVDGFSNAVRLPPVMKTAPQTLNPWGKELFGWRWPAPTAIWHVSEAFRAAGYNLTPPIVDSTMVDVSMQGAVWANNWMNLGEVVEVGGYGKNMSSYPRSYNSGGIMWMTKGVVYVGNNSKIDASTGFRASMLIPENISGVVDVTLVSSPDYLGLVVDERRNISLFQKKDNRRLIHIPSIDWAGRREVTVIYKPGFVTIHAGEVTRKEPTDFSGNFTGVRARVEEGGGIAGLQVDSLTHGDAYRIKGFTPTARVKSGFFTDYVQVCLPSVRDISARDLLDSVCSATMSSWWIDGDGVANFEDARSMITQRPSYSIEAADIGSYDITSDLLHSGSSIEISYSECARGVAFNHAMELWSKGGMGTAGSQDEYFLSPDEDDEEWIDPDFTFEKIKDWIGGFNSRNGSWWGACKNGARHDDPTVWADGYTFSSEAINPWTVKITESFSEDASRRVFEDSGIWRDLRGIDTPIMRGRGLIQRRDSVVSVAGGRKQSPVVKIDGRKWVDNRHTAARMAQWTMELLKSPPPVLESVSIAYAPQVRLAQVVNVSGYTPDGRDFLFGATLTCIVTGFEHRPDDGETRLKLRVVSINSTVRTWREVERATRASGLTWERVERQIGERGVTWSMFGSSLMDDGG